MLANLPGRMVPVEKSSSKRTSRTKKINLAKHDSFLREWVLRKEKRKRRIANGVDRFIVGSPEDNCHCHDYGSTIIAIMTLLFTVNRFILDNPALDPWILLAQRIADTIQHG
jgi:hypothetical protein